MSTGILAKKLQSFRTGAIASQREVNSFYNESAMERTSKAVREQLNKAATYRTEILKNVSAFGKLE